MIVAVAHGLPDGVRVGARVITDRQGVWDRSDLKIGLLGGSGVDPLGRAVRFIFDPTGGRLGYVLEGEPLIVDDTSLRQPREDRP